MRLSQRLASRVPLLTVAFVGAMIDAMRTTQAGFAQVGVANSGRFDQREIASVRIRITNPSPDCAFNQRIEDAVRRGIHLFSDERDNADAPSLVVEQEARRDPQIASIDDEPFPGVLGGVDVRVSDASDSPWNVVLRVSAFGTAKPIRAELRQQMTQDRGVSIVNVASVAGLRGFGGRPSCGASKHAVNGLTKNAAINCAP